MPDIKRTYNFMFHEGGIGSRHRMIILSVALVTAAWYIDRHYAISSLGFNRTTLRNEYKFRPDYLTGTIFMASRKELPQFKYF